MTTRSAILSPVLLSLAGAIAPAPESKVLFLDKLENLDNWHLEGLKDGITLPKPGTMRLDCQSKMGMVGAMAFCKQTFPDNIVIEYDLLVEKHNGLFITFVAATGLQGQDMLTGDVPPRTGIFEDYYNGTRSYHVSICRYEDDGSHTGVSNWRRNPGLHLMTSGKDWCTDTNKTYHVKIIKQGGHCRVEVDGQLGAHFTDPHTLPGPTPTSGKFGFRAIGAKAVFQVSNIKVSALTPENEARATHAP